MEKQIIIIGAADSVGLAASILAKEAISKTIQDIRVSDVCIEEKLEKLRELFEEQNISVKFAPDFEQEEVELTKLRAKTLEASLELPVIQAFDEPITRTHDTPWYDSNRHGPKSKKYKNGNFKKNYKSQKTHRR